MFNSMKMMWIMNIMINKKEKSENEKNYFINGYVPTSSNYFSSVRRMELIRFELKLKNRIECTENAIFYLFQLFV